MACQGANARQEEVQNKMDKTDEIKKTETDYCLKYITKLVLRAEEKLFLKSNKL